MTRRQETIILKLWRDWCRLWPEQYGHHSLSVAVGGYDPVFDVIPSQTYIDFYLEVARSHPALYKLNVFEVIDTALNQMRAPETSANLDGHDALDDIELRMDDADLGSTRQDIVVQKQDKSTSAKGHPAPTEPIKQRRSKTSPRVSGANLRKLA